MRYLGLDIGSTFIKGGVLDLDKASIQHIERLPFPETLPGLDPSFREYSPSEILSTSRALLERLQSHAPDAAGLVICSQMHSLVMVTTEGKPRSNVISWQDERALTKEFGTSSFDKLKQRITDTEWRELGNEPRPGVPLSFLYWMARHGQLPAGDVTASCLPALLVSDLCGTPPQVDATNAHAYGSLNVETMGWHRPVIEKLGLGLLDWPGIALQGAVLGEAELGGRRLVVHAPIGDFQCAQAGAFVGDDELSINISTGSGVLRLCDKLEGGDFQTRPFFDGGWAKVITHIPGGRALAALLKLLSELARAEGVALQDPWDYVLAETAKLTTTDLRVDPSFYFGAMGDRGAFANVREENLTIGHLFLAAFQGMADNYEKCAHRISPASDWNRVVFSGGVAQKLPRLRELICERLGAAHRIAASGEDTLLGLLTCAVAFSGRTPSVTDAMAFVREHYEPAPLTKLRGD
jgi:sugar (pentulose or hexulose) kinase